MRLYGQLPLKMDTEGPALKPFFTMLRKGFERIKRSDTEIAIHSIKKGLTNLDHLNYPGLRFLNDREVLKNILKAEPEGYDGVVILCVFDPALRSARQMLNIPVVGAFESSVHLAAMMGRRFAVITPEPSYFPQTEDNIRSYGMSDYAISHRPVRAIPLSMGKFMGCFVGDSSSALEAFQEIGRGCINDGAEVLIAGCGLLSTMLTHNGLLEVEGVPIIDPELVSICFAEMMVDLRRSGLPFISRKGLYIKPPDLEIKNILSTCFG